MQLAITKTNEVCYLNSQKNNIAVSGTLNELISDLLKIDWFKMLFDLYNNTVSNIEFFSSAESSPFSNLNSFNDWLISSYSDEKISELTFNVIKPIDENNFFTETELTAICKILLFLNKENFYNNESADVLSKSLYSLYPAKKVLTPLKEKFNDLLNIYDIPLFATNLEMLLYEVVKNCYSGDLNEYLFSKQHYFRSFFTDTKTKVWENYIQFTELFNNFLKCNIEKDLNDENKFKFNVIREFFNIPSLREKLIAETKSFNEKEDYSAFSKLSLTDFIADNSADSFKYKNYVFDLYENYEVKSIDVYKFNNLSELINFTVLYAKANTKLNFAKCPICNKYFVKDYSKRSENCIVCQNKILKENSSNDTSYIYKTLQGKMYTAKSRIINGDKYDDFYQYLLKEIYLPIIDEYKKYVDNYLNCLSKSSILKSTENYTTYAKNEKQLKIIQEYLSLQETENYEFKYSKDTILQFYTLYLTPAKFIKAFNNKEKATSVSKKNMTLEVLFVIMKQLFESTSGDLVNLKILFKKAIDYRNTL